MSTLTLFIFIIPVLILILLVLNLLFAIHKPDSEKVTPYECGFSPIGDSRNKFTIQFYLVGILFIIFDLELLFVYPLAVTLYHISTYGFWIATLFLIILTIGFVYEFGKGALKFTK